jgi:hypothetical protein
MLARAITAVQKYDLDMKLFTNRLSFARYVNLALQGMEKMIQ